MNRQQPQCTWFSFCVWVSVVPDTEKDRIALGINEAFTAFLTGAICKIHYEVNDWKITAISSRHWQHTWNLSVVSLCSQIIIMSCERPLSSEQEEQKKPPQMTNNSCPDVMLETQDGGSDGYKVRNHALPLFWQACSSDKPLAPGSKPVIPSLFLSTTFILSFLFIYLISLNNHVPWPVKNIMGSYCAAQGGD